MHNNNNSKTMFMVLSSWQSHWESSPGSFDGSFSLLSVCHKLLERLALQRISPTVEGLLSPDQAGFRKGRSTCDQVAALTTRVVND